MKVASQENFGFSQTPETEESLMKDETIKMFTESELDRYTFEQP